jgi:pimeloyl-ACP methyl ester carboxylesterase
MRAVQHPLPHGITLSGLQTGPEPAQVLLLHGFPEAAFVWGEVMQSLAPDIGCLAPNLRGYAGSSAPAAVQDYRPKALVTDLAALIESLGAPVELLVAHDWGGAVAWNLAAQRPDLLRRLLIINSPHPATFLRELRHSTEQQAASAYMGWLCRPDAAERLAADDFARLWGFFGAAVWLTPELRQQYREAWRHGLEGPLNYYRASPLRPAQAGADATSAWAPAPGSSTKALQSLELPDDAVTVRVPTRVLWGEQDVALRPGLLDGLERWVPQLHVQRLPDASHWLVHEHPALVSSAVREALATAPGAWAGG